MTVGVGVRVAVGVGVLVAVGVGVRVAVGVGVRVGVEVGAFVGEGGAITEKVPATSPLLQQFHGQLGGPFKEQIFV